MRPDMKVLHLYAGNLFGGIERLLLTLARHRGGVPTMEQHVALCFEGTLSAELRRVGVSPHMLGAVRASRPWSGWLARRRLGMLLAREEFDVVITHACWPLAMLGKAVVKFRGTKARRQQGRKGMLGPELILWAHDILSGAHWVERRAGKIPVDLVLANSAVTERSLANVFPGIRSERLAYPVEWPHGIDRQSARTAKRVELHTPADTNVVVCACRLERWKGHTLLLDALGHLRDEAGWVCWIAGGIQRDGERVYWNELQEQARRLGIADRVRFLGQRDDVPQLLAAADIHCQPNTGPEPFGIAFIEAMAAGLAVVTTRLGGPAEYITPGCGILVEPGDAQSLASAVSSMIKDEAARHRLGDAAREEARALCDPHRVMLRLRDILDRRLSGVGRTELPVASG